MNHFSINEATGRVQSLNRAGELLTFCNSLGLKATFAISANEPEDIAEFRELAMARLRPKYKRNTLCFCGSGKKYKKCCIDLPGPIPDILLPL